MKPNLLLQTKMKGGKELSCFVHFKTFCQLLIQFSRFLFASLKYSVRRTTVFVVTVIADIKCASVCFQVWICK